MNRTCEVRKHPDYKDTMKSIKNFALNAWIQVSSGNIEKRQLTKKSESEISTKNEDSFLGQSYSSEKFFGFPSFKKDSNVQYKKL